MGKIVQYAHHGIMVYVDEELKGKHREHCLCHRCRRFNPGAPETNCLIANLLYAICLKLDLVTPVYECPDYTDEEKI